MAAIARGPRDHGRRSDLVAKLIQGLGCVLHNLGQAMPYVPHQGLGHLPRRALDRGPVVGHRRQRPRPPRRGRHRPHRRPPGLAWRHPACVNSRAAGVEAAVADHGRRWRRATGACRCTPPKGRGQSGRRMGELGRQDKSWENGKPGAKIEDCHQPSTSGLHCLAVGRHGRSAASRKPTLGRTLRPPLPGPDPGLHPTSPPLNVSHLLEEGNECQVCSSLGHECSRELRDLRRSVLVELWVPEYRRQLVLGW